MQTFVALLKGINVSGKNIIKMEALKQMCLEIGLINVRTYIQSGNFAFESTLATSVEIQKRLEQSIQKTFLISTNVLVYTKSQIQTIIQQNPFLTNADLDDKHLHVTFLASEVSTSLLKSLYDKLQPLEQLFYINGVIYLYCPYGYGKTKVNNQTIIQKLKTAATTRNWKTTQALFLLVEKNKNQL